MEEGYGGIQEQYCSSNFDECSRMLKMKELTDEVCNLFIITSYYCFTLLQTKCSTGNNIAVNHFAITGEGDAALNSVLECLKVNSSLDEILASGDTWSDSNIAEKAIPSLNVSTLLLAQGRTHEAHNILSRMVQYLHLLSEKVAIRVCMLYLQSACGLITTHCPCDETASGRANNVATHLHTHAKSLWEATSTRTDETPRSIEETIAIICCFYEYMMCSQYHFLVGPLELADEELEAARHVCVHAMVPLADHKDDILARAYLSFCNLFDVGNGRGGVSGAEVCRRATVKLAVAQV